MAMLLGFCIALGIGLLIGAERERRKGRGPNRGAAGIRTFAVAALLGAVGAALGGGTLLAVTVLIVGALSVIAYRRGHEEDPGMTTEIALVLTCLLGGLAMSEPALAAGVGVVLAILLAARERIHHFVRGALSERELHDALLFLAAALLALPLMPDRLLGPYDAINPRAVAELVVLVMAISASGYIATRIVGPRYGLALAGLAGGFVSSTATIHSMGRRIAGSPALLPGAAAGAVLSSIATMIQMGVVIYLLQPDLAMAMMRPLGLGALAAIAYSLFFINRRFAAAEKPGDTPVEFDAGRAFDWKAAVIFAALVAVLSVVSAAMNAWLGYRGALLSASITGLADPHATAASIASLVAAGKMPTSQAITPILAGLSANAVVKAAVAFHSGGRDYALRIVPGLALVVAAIWLGQL